MTLRTLLIALLLPLASLPTSAWAIGGAAAEFGHAGQIVPNGKFNFTLDHQAGVDIVDFLVAPTLLYFITDHLAVGGGITVELIGTPGPDPTLIGLQPTIAYHIPINDSWTFFPQGSLYFQAHGSDPQGNVLGLEAYAPFLFHAASHFFLGAGPVLRFDIANEASRLFRIGVTSVVGGYF